MTGHTAGKWTVRENANNHWGMREVVGPAVSVTGFTIATDVDAAKAARIEADCRLIAAAPLLLEALKEAERFMDYFANDMTRFVGPGTPTTCLEQIRSAIAAATRRET